jgi:hypothetical protein
VFWLMIVCPLGAFLIIRGLRLIDQDKWVGFRGRTRRSTPNRESASSFSRYPDEGRH